MGLHRDYYESAESFYYGLLNGLINFVVIAGVIVIIGLFLAIMLIVF